MWKNKKNNNQRGPQTIQIRSIRVEYRLRKEVTPCFKEDRPTLCVSRGVLYETHQ